MAKPPATLWIKLDLGDAGQIGPGKIALLKAIGRERSIAAAARAMGMSYRRAWLLVNELNRAFDEPVVATHVGGRRRGGAELTPGGTALIARYEEIAAAAEAATAGLRRDLTDGG
jgi:molybdate transport system regulatory protein